MKLYLPLKNSPNKLISEIANVITDHYPAGIDLESPEYDEYPGMKKILAIVSENMTNHNVFGKPWKSFLINLRKQSKKRILNTSYAHQISFSAELILEKYQDASLIRIKKLVFAVSLIAPFYSICGVDETIIKENDNLWHYRAINVVTSSPYKEFESCFNFIEVNINSMFKNHQLVPFRVSMYGLKDIKIPDGNQNNVHNALFNNSFDQGWTGLTRGNDLYGFDTQGRSITLLPPPNE